MVYSVEKCHQIEGWWNQCRTFSSFWVKTKIYLCQYHRYHMSISYVPLSYVSLSGLHLILAPIQVIWDSYRPFFLGKTICYKIVENKCWILNCGLLLYALYTVIRFFNLQQIIGCLVASGFTTMTKIYWY